VWQAQWRLSRHLPRALASGGAGSAAPRHGEVPLGARRRGKDAWGRVAEFSLARIGVAEGAKRGEISSRATCEVLFGAQRRARARRHTTCSPARCSARVGVGEGAGARDLRTDVVVMCSSARAGVGKAWRPAAPLTPGGLGRHWAASSVAFGSGRGKALPGAPRKAPLCSLTALRAGPPFSWGVTSGGPPEGRSLSKDGTRADGAKDFCRLVGGV